MVYEPFFLLNSDHRGGDGQNMSTLFRRSSNISCFFCQELIDPLPRDPRSFRCPHCTCWNRYNAKGEIMSDEPAMHDEALNMRSFAKRASPSKNRLPTMYGANRGIFCHTCQTNQMLLTNLLSNYLPPFEHPEYNDRLKMLSEYRESLHVRYPPVCENCLPAVEEEIRLKDQMARTKALGGWLKQSKGKEKKRKISRSALQGENLSVSLLAWKVRGCLWSLSLLTAIVGNSTVTFGYALPRQTTYLYTFLPAVTLLSLLWAVWDPTYASFRKAQIQGRDVRLQGKRTYIILQMLSWFSRLTTSVLLAVICFHPHQDYLHLSYYPTSFRSRIYFSLSLALEVSTLLGSCYVLRLRHPPKIRLLDTNGHRFPSDTPSPQTSARSSPAPRPSAEPDLLTSLTLSSTPIIPTASNPIFGFPSLLSANAGLSSPERMAEDDGDDEDAMDWTPTDPSSTSKLSRSSCKPAMNDDSDGSWLRPQRFFPPEQPTGLEGLFARTLLVDDSNDRPATPSSPRSRPKILWWVVCTLLLVPSLAFAYIFRWRWKLRRVEHVQSP